MTDKINFMTIKIINIINTPNAILQKFGWEVFEKVAQSLRDGKAVELSFEGIENLTSSFCHASIGKLYAEFGAELDEKLNLAYLKKDNYWLDRVNEAKYLALNPEEQVVINDLIADLFE